MYLASINTVQVTTARITALIPALIPALKLLSVHYVYF